MNIAVIIPAFNEQENLFKLTTLIKKYINSKIIIVDDSISNETEKIIKKKKLIVIILEEIKN